MIYPLIADAPPEEVHKLVLGLVKERRWRLVADMPLVQPDTEGRTPQSAPVGRIEAVAKSLVLGLEDDIAIRLSDQDGRTRVDMRSPSRYGAIDFGANAERVSDFLEELRTRTLVPGQAGTVRLPNSGRRSPARHRRRGCAARPDLPDAPAC